MVNLSNAIEVKKDEKRIYDILKDLEIKGECIIKNANDPEWKKTFITLGWKTKPLLDGKIIDRPIIWDTGTNRKEFRDMRLISIPKDIEVKESEGNNKSFFYFNKRRSLF